MQGQAGHNLSSPMSSEKDDSNDGLNGDIKKEPELTSPQSVYTDLQKALPGAGILPGLDMQTNGNTHNSHHPAVALNNGGHPGMGHMLQEYQTL